jgi:hypothetical protein
MNFQYISFPDLIIAFKLFYHVAYLNCNDFLQILFNFQYTCPTGYSRGLKFEPSIFEKNIQGERIYCFEAFSNY